MALYWIAFTCVRLVWIFNPTFLKSLDYHNRFWIALSGKKIKFFHFTIIRGIFGEETIAINNKKLPRTRDAQLD